MATASDIQAKISQGFAKLEQTSRPGTKWVAQHGTDWTKWPQDSNWYQGAQLLHDASSEAGQLPELKASFAAKVA